MAADFKLPTLRALLEDSMPLCTQDDYTWVFIYAHVQNFNTYTYVLEWDGHSAKLWLIFGEQ